jgi:hypothetical protein
MEVSEDYTITGIYNMVNFFEQEEIPSFGSLVSCPPSLPFVRCNVRKLFCLSGGSVKLAANYGLQ